MLIGYNWPNETKLLRGVPILVERCEFISKMFSFVFAWRPKVLEICIEKILFLRKKWEFFQKSPLFPAIFPIFAKIAYFPSGVTVWKRRPPTFISLFFWRGKRAGKNYRTMSPITWIVHAPFTCYQYVLKKIIALNSINRFITLTCQIIFAFSFCWGKWAGKQYTKTCRPQTKYFTPLLLVINTF